MLASGECCIDKNEGEQAGLHSFLTACLVSKTYMLHIPLQRSTLLGYSMDRTVPPSESQPQDTPNEAPIHRQACTISHYFHQLFYCSTLLPPCPYIFLLLSYTTNLYQTHNANLIPCRPNSLHTQDTIFRCAGPQRYKAAPSNPRDPAPAATPTTEPKSADSKPHRRPASTSPGKSLYLPKSAGTRIQTTTFVYHPKAQTKTSTLEHGLQQTNKGSDPRVSTRPPNPTLWQRQHPSYAQLTTKSSTDAPQQPSSTQPPAISRQQRPECVRGSTTKERRRNKYEAAAQNPNKNSKIPSHNRRRWNPFRLHQQQPACSRNPTANAEAQQRSAAETKTEQIPKTKSKNLNIPSKIRHHWNALRSNQHQPTSSRDSYAKNEVQHKNAAGIHKEQPPKIKSKNSKIPSNSRHRWNPLRLNQQQPAGRRDPNEKEETPQRSVAELNTEQPPKIKSRDSKNPPSSRHHWNPKGHNIRPPPNANCDRKHRPIFADFQQDKRKT